MTNKFGNMENSLYICPKIKKNHEKSISDGVRKGNEGHRSKSQSQ